MTPDRRALMQLALLAGAFTAPPAAAGAAAPTPAKAAAKPPGDFDWLHGAWRVRHRRLKTRLANSREWQEFDGTCVCQPLLGGLGNVDDNWLDLPAGAYRGVGLRAYDPKSRTWAIWWLDDRNPHALDVPVIGRFENGVGTFLADDVQEGRPVKVRFQWSQITPRSAVWEQAFSADGGQTWEINWHMEFTRTA